MNIIGRFFPRTIIVIITGFVSIGTPAWARGPVPGDTKQPWSISIGTGVAMVPTFAGSDRYRALPLPLLDINWRDTILLNPGGLSAQFKHGALRVGGGITFDGGRKDHSTGGPFDSGDDRLKGLGDIDFAVGVKGFVSYRLGFLNLDATATKFTGRQNDGVTATVGMSAPVPLGHRKVIVIPSVRATFGNDDYMQTFFGVTAQQSAASQFRTYNAGGGVRDVSAGVNIIYNINRHWFADVNLNGTRFLNSAAKSPISVSDTNGSILTAVGYHF
jgi:outer membrane protein